MFSGIIEERAKVKKVLKTSQGCMLTVQSEIASKDARIGDSISVNGVCLTVVEINPVRKSPALTNSGFSNGVKGKDVSFDIMEETLRRTSLTELSVGKFVNLERSLKIGDKISGHFVTGHVDCIGKIRAITKRPNDHAMDVEFPPDKKSYLKELGSIAIDGVSLTVAEIKGHRLRVYLIPLTLKATNLGVKKRGDSVNIELDILSKYAQQISPSKESKITSEFLKKHGFV